LVSSSSKILRKKEVTTSKFAKDKDIVKRNTLTWDFKIFEKITEDAYQIHEFKWKETIYLFQSLNLLFLVYLRFSKLKGGKKIEEFCLFAERRSRVNINIKHDLKNSKINQQNRSLFL